MTILLIAVGVMGYSELAADIAIVQGASLAVFFAFSANARSIILGNSTKISWLDILRSRVLLVVPLGGAALVICLYLTGAAPVLACALILRRCSEWILEIHLARREREKDYRFALWFIVIQSLLLAVAISLAPTDPASRSLGFFLWAIVPMTLSGGFLWKHFRIGRLLDPSWAQLLPHFGSTAITGMTVFVFRLVILLIVGKAYAGNLFTAFAIGGILSSVFAQALGPTLIFHAKEGFESEIPKWLKVSLIGSAGVGTALFLSSAANWQALLATGRPSIFWSAIGASLVGGAIMVLAQRFRFRLLQHHKNEDAFGPDVLTNIFIVACVPYTYYLLGGEALSGLFLINAVIALIFYASAERTVSSNRKATNVDSPLFKQAIAVGLVIPLFFQLMGKIFRDKQPLLDSGGDLLNLPIPISVIVCYGAIVVIGNFGRARESLSVIFLCFCLMTLTTVLSTHGEAEMQQAKIILLIQFILPMLALVLGQTYGGSHDAEESFAQASLYVLVLVIPLQMVATLSQGLPFLSPYVYLFSIYQHLQYVPLVFVCAYIIACFVLWHEIIFRMVLVALAAPIGAYATFSISLLTVSVLLAGTIIFMLYRYRSDRKRELRGPFVMLFLIAIGIIGAITLVTPNLAFAKKVDDNSDKTSVMLTIDSGSPRDQRLNDVTTRLRAWKFYIKKMTSDGGGWLLGQPSPPDRTLYPSAHNYYLDFIYNFGFLALVPILWLVAITLWKSGRYWREIAAEPQLFALTGIVIILLLLDNSIKVGLRQPYSGIVTFFLWGMLLTKLRDLGISKDVDVEKRFSA